MMPPPLASIMVLSLCQRGWLLRCCCCGVVAAAWCSLSIVSAQAAGGMGNGAVRRCSHWLCALHNAPAVTRFLMWVLQADCMTQLCARQCLGGAKALLAAASVLLLLLLAPKTACGANEPAAGECRSSACTFWLNVLARLLIWDAEQDAACVAVLPVLLAAGHGAQPCASSPCQHPPPPAATQSQPDHRQPPPSHAVLAPTEPVTQRWLA